MTRPISTMTGPQARQWSARKTRSFVLVDELSHTRPRSDLDPLHGAVLLVSGRASSLGWVYPAMVSGCSLLRECGFAFYSIGVRNSSRGHMSASAMCALVADPPGGRPKRGAADVPSTNGDERI